MVLLSILAIGMLSLATVELRSLSRSDNAALARANAMLALKLAIGELQASAGLDQRVTAPGGILGDSTDQQRITGVWKANRLGPNSSDSDFTKTKKTNQFVKWLVSSPDRSKLEIEDFAKTSPGSGTSVVDLVSAANLDDPKLVVKAQKVRIRKTPGADPTGSYAYAVLDEGVKARVNLGTLSPAGSFASKSTALGSGQRPLLDGIPGIGSVAAANVDLDNPGGRSLTSKMVSLPTAEFAYGSTPNALKRKIHDLTSTSVGVLADVANGGLKRDLNSLADMKSTGGLPSEYANQKIYQQSFGTSIISDPSWDRALAWAGIFNNPNFTKQTVAGTSVPTLTASAPAGWTAGTGKSSGGYTNPASATLSLIDPPGAVLLPSVAKIQMSFALAARDIYRYNDGDPKLAANTEGVNPGLHGPWDNIFQEDLNQSKKKVESPYDYLLHMIYSPIITLHNPYNVPLSFSDLRVEFVNVPFAFQVFKNGIPQTTAPVPFAQMYGNTTAGGQSKRFGLKLGVDSAGNPKPEILLPGEVKTYSPNLPPDRSWQTEVTAQTKVFWDWGNRNMEDDRENKNTTATDTSRGNGIAGWNGTSVGYDLDFLCPGSTKAYTVETYGTSKFSRWDGVPLKKGDSIYVESTPMPDPKLSEKKFSVEMTLASGIATKSRSTALIFSFNDPNDVPEVMMSKNPQAKNLRIRAPKGTDTWSTDQLFDHSTVTLRNIKNTRPIALFSAYAKTTAGGDPSGEEGIWVAKPFSFQNHTSVAIEQKLKSGHPSHYSHELALTRFPELGIGIQEGTNRAKFITGHSDFRGRHFGSIYDVPLAPMQSLVSLNTAQLAAGTYLPHFSAPVGNSYAHPLLPASSVLIGGAAGYEYADHSFLLNVALFDTYYCSGLQSHASAAMDGDGKTRPALVSEFIAASEPGQSLPSPLPDPHLKAFFPGGMSSADATAALNGNEGYRNAASIQMVEGAFNVNSVSVAAWKAVLSSMTGEEAMTLATPDSTSNASSLAKVSLAAMTDQKGGRFSRFRIPNGQAKRKDPDGFWRGPTDLTDSELTLLSEEIVKQVRERGPFLSMAEFVNRQLGTADEKTLAGALQTAIDKSGVNSGVSVSAAAGIQISGAQTADLQMPNAAALLGDSAQGAPGYLMQSDVLAVLGNNATVRSDTFTIRAYGEALDKTGNVTARAYCEAVVQRTPDYVDPSDKATVLPASLTSVANKDFGRRFQLVSMRWLSPDEI